MKISVIIPAFNEERLLGRTLDGVNSSCEVFTKLGWLTEIIVCDNKSTDSTAAIARAAGATVVFEPVNQIARARNRGAQAASGDWLLFIDADSLPSPGLFTEVAAQIQLGCCLAGGCTLTLDCHSRAGLFIAGLWNRLSRARRLFAGSFIFCEAAAFRQVGGFSQELFAGEELELSACLGRLARETGREIVILHRHPLVTSDRKLRLYGWREHLRFLWRAGFNYRRTVTNREACHTWYDGRR